MKRVSAIAYSSSANLGPGYDTFGLSHNAFSSTVTVTESSGGFPDSVKLDAKGLPVSPYENTAGLAVTELLKELDINEKFTIAIDNGIPTGLGLGSSGASAAAAVHAIDVLLDLKLPMNQKIKYAMLGEAASSGTPHADNVAASLVGGLIVVESIDPVSVRQIKITDKFSFLTIIPEMFIKSKTKISREVVPDKIELKKHVQGIRYAASLIAGLINGDPVMIREGMNDDIVEEARQQLYPFYPEVKKSLLANDAVGVCLSGAGPSILAVLDEGTDREKMVKDATKVLSQYGFKSKVAFSTIAGGVSDRETAPTS